MREQQIFLIDQRFHDVNPVDCGWQKCPSAHAFGPTVRLYYLLHYVVQGSGVFRAGGKEHAVRAGQMFIIRPFEETFYQADALTPWEYIWIGFTAKIPMPACIKEAHVVASSTCGEIFSSMLEAENMREGRELYLAGKVLQLLARLCQREGGEGDYAQQAKTYMQSNYMRDISIAELAARLNLNRSYFSTLFKSSTGKSPQRYLTDYRMEKACELMTEHGYTPGEAARATGYPDIFSFSRMFKQRYGMAPSAYRSGGGR